MSKTVLPLRKGQNFPRAAKGSLVALFMGVTTLSGAHAEGESLFDKSTLIKQVCYFPDGTVANMNIQQIADANRISIHDIFDHAMTFGGNRRIFLYQHNNDPHDPLLDTASNCMVEWRLPSSAATSQP